MTTENSIPEQTIATETTKGSSQNKSPLLRPGVILLLLITALIGTTVGWLLGSANPYQILETIPEEITMSQKEETVDQMQESPITPSPQNSEPKPNEIVFTPPLNPSSKIPGWSDYTNRYAGFEVSVPTPINTTETIWVDQLADEINYTFRESMIQGRVVFTAQEEELTISYGLPRFTGAGGGGCDQGETSTTIGGIKFHGCRDDNYLAMFSDRSQQINSDYHVYAKSSGLLSDSTVQKILDTLRFY